MLTTYSRTGTKYTLNKDGIYVPHVADDLEPDFSTGVAGYLAEPERENVITHSHTLSSWSVDAAHYVVVDNDTTAPDSTTSAAKLGGNAGGNTGTGGVQIAVAGLATSSNYAFSLFVKEDQYNSILVRIENTASHYIEAGFDIGTLASFGINAAGHFTTPAVAYDALNNGWYRIRIAFSSSDSAPVLVRLYPYDDGAAVSPVANDEDGVHVWGIQLEEGLTSSSPIITTGSTVTRGGDELTSTIGVEYSTEIVSYFIEVETAPVSDIQGNPDLEQTIINVSNNHSLTDRYIVIIQDDAPGNELNFNSNSETEELASGATVFPEKNIKLAFSFDGEDLRYSVNGGAIGTYTLTSPINLANMTVRDIGWLGGGSARQFGGTIKKLTEYPYGLSDATMQALTS